MGDGFSFRLTSRSASGNTRHEVQYDPSEKAVGCRQNNASSFVGVDWRHWASGAHTLIL